MKKIMLYLSAFLPMFWLILIKDFATIFFDAIKGEAKYTDLLNVQLFIILGIVILLTICAIILISKNEILSKDLVVVKNVKNRTVEYYLEYFSLFVLELFAFSFTEMVDIIVMVLLLFLLGVVYIKNGLFFINPTLNIFKSFILEVEFDNGKSTYTKILICKEMVKPTDKLYLDISDYGFTFAQKVK